MKVKARFGNADAKFGFYDTQVRHHDQEFTLLDEKDFDESWMVWVEKPKPVEPKAKPKTKPKAAKKDDDDIDLNLGI